MLCFAGASEGIFAANMVLVLPSTIYSSDLGATPTDRFRVGAGRRGLELGLAAMGAHLDATIRTS